MSIEFTSEGSFHLSLPELPSRVSILVAFVALRPTTQKNSSENSVPNGVKLEKQSKTKPRDLGVAQQDGAIQDINIGRMGITVLGLSEYLSA